MSIRRRSQGVIHLACAALGSVVGDVVAGALTGHGTHGGAGGTAVWLSVFLPVSALASLVLHPAVLRAADAVCDQEMAEDRYGEGVAGNLVPVFWGDDVRVSVTSLARRSSVMERMLVRGLYPGLALAIVALVDSLAPMSDPVAVLVLVLALIVLGTFSERVIVPPDGPCAGPRRRRRRHQAGRGGLRLGDHPRKYGGDPYACVRGQEPGLLVARRRQPVAGLLVRPRHRRPRSYHPGTMWS